MCDKNNFFLKQSLKETRSYAPSFNLRRANQRRANLRRASGDSYIFKKKISHPKSSTSMNVCKIVTVDARIYVYIFF